MLLAGAFAILLLARPRLASRGALAAAIVFAYGGSAAWRIQHVGQILSLVLLADRLAAARARWTRSRCSRDVAGVVAGFMALGRDQVAYLGLWVLVGAVLWSWAAAPLRRAAIRRSLPPLLLAALAGALVVVVPVVLTMLLSASSNRAAIDLAGAGQGSLHPALLFTGVIPNLFGADGPFLDYWGPPSPRWGPVDLFFARNMGVVYIGALPIAAIAVGAMRGVLWAREVRFFTIAAAALIVYALGRYTPAFGLLFWHLPGVDLFRRPADATFLYGALAAILAGYSIHRWWSGTLPAATPWHRAAEILMVASLFGGATVLALHKGAPTATFVAIAGSLAWLGAALTLVAADSARLRRSHAWATAATAAVPAFLVADLAWNNGPNESTALPPAVYEVLRPESRDPLLGAAKARLGDGSLDRIELTGLGFHWPNASLVHRLHNVLGYNPVRLALYAVATGAEDTVALPEQRKFSPLFPSYRSTMADLLGLRFIATGVPIETIDPKLRPGDLNLLGSYGGRYLYENPRAMPRVLFADRAASADFAAMLKSGEWPDVDLRTTVLLNRHDRAEPGRDGERGGTARVVAYRNNEVVIEADSPRGGYVVLNDPHHPWWFAAVDGADAQILRANVLFRAVAVPPGRHTVRFEFRPLAGAWRELMARRP